MFSFQLLKRIACVGGEMSRKIFHIIARGWDVHLWQRFSSGLTRKMDFLHQIKEFFYVCQIISDLNLCEIIN